MLLLDEVWGHQRKKVRFGDGGAKGKAVKDQKQQNAASSNKMLLPPQFIPANTFRRLSGWKQGSVRFKSQLGTFSADGWSSIHSVGCDKAGLFFKESFGLIKNKAQCCPLQIKWRKQMRTQHMLVYTVCCNEIVKRKSTSMQVTPDAMRLMFLQV